MNLASANLTNADLPYAVLTGADLTGTDLRYAHLPGVDLYGADLKHALYVETTTGSPYYYPNTTLPSGFDPVAQGWTLSPYCDFTPDAACDLADINQMFQAGNLVTGVTTSGSTDRLDLVDNDIIDTADITEWLAQAATQTVTVHPTCVATPNLTATWTSLTSMCWPITSIPRGMEIQ